MSHCPPKKHCAPKSHGLPENRCTSTTAAHRKTDHAKADRRRVTKVHTKIVWHGTDKRGKDGILLNGTMPGGGWSGRDNTFFSIVDPREPRRKSLEFYESNDFSWNAPVLEPYHFDKPYLVAIDVAKAEEAGAEFWQTRAMAVITDHKVPPECVMAVIDRKSNQVIYGSLQPGEQPKEPLPLKESPVEKCTKEKLQKRLLETSFHHESKRRRLWDKRDEHRKDDKEHHSRAPLHQQAQAYKTSQRATPYSRTDQSYDVYDGTPSATAASSSVPAPFPQTPGHEDPLATLRTENRSFASRG